MVRLLSAELAAAILGMMIRAATLKLPEVMTRVMSLGCTPSNLAARLDLKVACALSSKSEISPATVMAMSRTGS